MDMRMKTLPFSHGGRDYTLVCNMNVLADLEEENGGDFLAVLSRTRTMKSILQVLAAAMNDCAIQQGWSERYTARQLGRELTKEDFASIAPGVIDLVISAVRDDKAGGDSEKNAETTQS